MRLFNARLGYTAEHVYENNLHRVGNLCGMKDVRRTKCVWKIQVQRELFSMDTKLILNSFPFKTFTYLAV